MGVDRPRSDRLHTLDAVTRGGAVSIGGGVGVDWEVGDDGGDAETNGFGG